MFRVWTCAHAEAMADLWHVMVLSVLSCQLGSPDVALGDAACITKINEVSQPEISETSNLIYKSDQIFKKRNKLPPSTILTVVILLDAECSTCCSFWVCQGLIVDVQEKQKDWQRLARALLDFGLFRLFGLLGCRPHSGHMPIATVMTISYAFTIGFRRNFIVFHNLIP